MRTSVIGLLLLACVVTLSNCSGSAMPSSPTALTPLTAPGAGGGRFRTLEDPPALPVDPSNPTPDPANPTPDPLNPAPDPNAPTPMAVIINIIGTFGTGAFLPNPTMANMGDMIVWQNNDSQVHHIVLDDGTDLGETMPGQASLPTPLTTPTAGFHCTIHPTMVGSINGVAEEPYMPPTDDYYGYYGVGRLKPASTSITKGRPEGRPLR